MSYLLWNRQLALTVGSNLSPENSIVIGNGLDAFKVDFNIVKTNESTTNKSIITIYNLPPSARDSLDSEFDRVTLRLGYSGDGAGFMFVVMDGWIDKVTHTRAAAGVDILTSLQCSEGGADYQFARVNKTYAGGTPYKDVAYDIINNHMELLTVGDISGIPEAYKIPKDRPRTITKSAKDALDEIAENSDAKWTIDNNVIDFVSSDGHVGENLSVPLISYGTGMIGSPQKTEKGITVESLIIPNLRANRLVKVVDNFLTSGRADRKLIPSTTEEATALQKSIAESRNDPEKSKEFGIRNGDNDIYKILKVKYYGSNYGGDFKVQLDCQNTTGYAAIRPKLDRSPVAGVIRGSAC